MRRAAGVVALFVLLGSAVAQAKSEDDYVAEIADLAQQQRYSESLRLAEQAMAELPDSATLHLQYGSLLMVVFDMVGARTQLEAALALAPEVGAIHAQLAVVTQVAGEDERALGYAKRALELDPDDQDTRALLAELEITARIRKGEQVDFAAGSPGAVARDFFSLIRSDQVKTALDRCLHPDLIRRVLHKLGGSESDRDELVRGMVKGLRQELARPGTDYLGMLFEEPVVDADLARVPAYTLSVTRPSKDQAEFLRNMIDSPELSQHLDPALIEVYRGLEPADRERFAKNLTRRTISTLLPIEVELTRQDDGQWRITDLSADLGGSRIALTTYIDNMPAFFTAMGKEMPKLRSRRGLAENIGRVTGVVMILLVIFAVLRRALKSG